MIARSPHFNPPFSFIFKAAAFFLIKAKMKLIDQKNVHAFFSVTLMLNQTFLLQRKVALFVRAPACFTLFTHE